MNERITYIFLQYLIFEIIFLTTHRLPWLHECFDSMDIFLTYELCKEWLRQKAHVNYVKRTNHTINNHTINCTQVSLGFIHWYISTYKCIILLKKQQEKIPKNIIFLRFFKNIIILTAIKLMLHDYNILQ